MEWKLVKEIQKGQLVSKGKSKCEGYQSQGRRVYQSGKNNCAVQMLLMK